MLSLADDDTQFTNMVNNTVGVVFYSVPHRGSTLAQLSNTASYIVAPTVEVQEMGRGVLLLFLSNLYPRSVYSDQNVCSLVCSYITVVQPHNSVLALISDFEYLSKDKLSIIDHEHIVVTCQLSTIYVLLVK